MLTTQVVSWYLEIHSRKRKCEVYSIWSRFGTVSSQYLRNLCKGRRRAWHWGEWRCKEERCIMCVRCRQTYFTWNTLHISVSTINFKISRYTLYF